MKGFQNFTHSEIRKVKSTGIKMPMAEYNKNIVRKDGNVFLSLSTDTFEEMALPSDQENGDMIHLIPPEEFDYEVDSDDGFDFDKLMLNGPKSLYKKAALPELTEYVQHDKLKNKSRAHQRPSLNISLSSVDHRKRQSPIKHQGNRGTCVAHATCAALEAIYQRPFDLSEQLAHTLFNRKLNRDDRLNKGLRTTDAAQFLTKPNLTCTEKLMPYMKLQAQVIAACNGTSRLPIPPAASSKAKYGIKKSLLIGDNGLNGKSIRNTNYLESFLAAGYDIVLGSWVSFDDNSGKKVIEPVFKGNGQLIKKAGHAMLLVGYDSTKQYFICKNSWGNTWGNNGYAYLSYNYARVYFKYGFIITQTE